MKKTMTFEQIAAELGYTRRYLLELSRKLKEMEAEEAAATASQTK